MRDDSIYYDLARTFNTYSDTKVVFGTIKEYFPVYGTVNVYVPNTGGIVYNVKLLFPSNSRRQKNMSIPELESSVLLCYTSVGGKAVALGGLSTLSRFGTEDEMEETLLPGENLMNSSGDGFLKQDIAGNVLLESAGRTFAALQPRGTVYCSTFKHSTQSIAMESASGLTITELIAEQKEEVSLPASFVFHQNLKLPYAQKLPEDITKEDIEAIKDETRELLRIIRGDTIESSYTHQITKAENLYQKYNKKETQETLSQLESYIDQFILPHSGVTMKVAFNETQQDGSVDFFHLSILDEEGNETGSIKIDAGANINIKMANLTLP